MRDWWRAIVRNNTSKLLKILMCLAGIIAMILGILSEAWK